MERFVLKLAYKGTQFHGWQVQQNANTIQGEIERALEKIYKTPIETIGCGRTDTGVHAKEFYMHFDSPCDIPKNLLIRLNQLISNDIAIYTLYRVPPEFNVRFEALSRSYEYVITYISNPFLKELSWHYYRPLDIDKMNEACNLLLSHKDFQCFSKVHTEVNNYICNITHAQWEPTENGVIFKISANRFLRNMVRAIVGTMILVGTNKLDLAGFIRVLESKNRKDAGESVPAAGLFLTQIIYPSDKLELNETLK